MTKESIKRWLRAAYKFKNDQFNDSVEVFKDLLDKLDDTPRSR